MTPGANEVALLEKAKAGDAQAFCDLVRLHQAKVRMYIAYHLHRSDMVDDLAQDVFLAAFRKIGEFQSDRTLKPWLIGIAQKRVVEFLRNDSRRQTGNKRSFDSMLHEWRAGIVEVEGQGDGREHEYGALTQCIQSLPPGSAEIVTQHYFEARPLVEIAAKLNKKESALRMALLRIRQALRDCLQRRMAEA